MNVARKRVTPFALGGDRYMVVSTELPDLATLEELTPAERDVVAAVLRGRNNAEIAAERGCAYRTVANQLASVYRKLGVSSRHELLARLVAGE